MGGVRTRAQVRRRTRLGRVRTRAQVRRSLSWSRTSTRASPRRRRRRRRRISTTGKVPKRREAGHLHPRVREGELLQSFSGNLFLGPGGGLWRLVISERALLGVRWQNFTFTFSSGLAAALQEGVWSKFSGTRFSGKQIPGRILYFRRSRGGDVGVRRRSDRFPQKHFLPERCPVGGVRLLPRLRRLGPISVLVSRKSGRSRIGTSPTSVSGRTNVKNPRYEAP